MINSFRTLLAQLQKYVTVFCRRVESRWKPQLFSITIDLAEGRWKPFYFSITLGLVAIVLMFGWMSTKKVRETVVGDFNQQQLVFARHAASQTEAFFDIIKREMLLLSRHPSLSSPDPAFLEKLLPLSFALFADEGLIEIRYFDAVAGQAYRAVPQGKGFNIEKPNARDRKFAALMSGGGSEESRFHALLEHQPSDSAGKHSALLYLARTVHDQKNSRLRGVLVCVVDGLVVAERRLKDIRSGETGYAWMIDSSGIFLYHYMPEFVGKNAFDVRREMGAPISFVQIDTIQREKMLKGAEGMGTYVSGWHRGERGIIKKLIAFSPIQIFAGPEPITWSVAVAAPMDEVEGSIAEIQFRQYLLEGSIIFLVLIVSLIAFAVMAQWSTMLEDEVRRKTDELMRSENQYSLIVDHASDIIYTVDRSGTILTINKAGVDFFIKPKEELIGGNIGSIWLNEANAAKQHAAIGEVFATGENRQLVYSLTISNSEIWLSTGYSLIAGGTGKTPAVLAISRDVTERKRTEERMYHTEKLASLGTLAAGVAHEINNPLAVILGFTDILLEKAPQDSESSEMLKTIEKQANNAKRVVENLLSFARYRDIKEELVDINESIEEVLRVVGNSLRVNRVTVVKHLAWDLPRFKGDSRQIEQVVLNIINNAVYAMKGSGALTIATGTAEIGNAVEIRITDTGTGIKKEHRGKIFDPLFTTKGVGEGTGLGLSVCYAIVSKYGGSITFETRTADEGPPVGTTFIVTLPAAKWGDQGKQRVDGEHWKVFS